MEEGRTEAGAEAPAIKAILPRKPLFPYFFFFLIFVTFGAHLHLVPMTSGLILACLLTPLVLQEVAHSFIPSALMEPSCQREIQST